jgi:nitrogen regulatory protein P-II 1
MKKIEAIIQPFKLDEVRQALIDAGVEGMTITDVRGRGGESGHKEVYRGREHTLDLLPRIKLEMVVPNQDSGDVIRSLTTAARTGKIGDGKVFVFDVVDALRIRNEQRGEAAL